VTERRPGAAARLQDFLEANIPLSGAMEVEVVEAGPEGVRIRAPLGPNGNHHGTLFGGSASALAILAAWGWMHLRLDAEGLDPDLVIQRSATEFVHPGRSAVEAVCGGAGEGRWRRFLRSYRRFGKGRLELESEVRVDGTTVARMEGAFVALEAGGEG